MKQIDETEKQKLLEFLAQAIRNDWELSAAAFNELPGKPVTERVYRRVFGTWNAAKKMAIELLPAQPKSQKQSVKMDRLKKTIRELRKENNKLYKEYLTVQEVREQIFGLTEITPAVPDWVVNVKQHRSLHGVPALLLSDLHLGEVVKPEDVFGVNAFNMEVAAQRIHTLAHNTLDILTNHLKSDYPGLVLLLNGDIVSGCIHEELLITNEQPIMPVVIRAYELLAWFIEQMYQTIGKVQVFCCHGNHSRTFKKPLYKESALSSYDWLICFRG
jgi:hypothetical protein